MSFFQSQTSKNQWPPLDEDLMTGLPNLFALLSDFQEIIDKTSGVAAIIDIKNMKAFNSRHGRKAGDDLIVQVSRTISAALEKTGLRSAHLYRTGGDEFCVIVPEIEHLPEAFLKVLSEPQSLAAGNSDRATLPLGWTYTICAVLYFKGKSDAHEVLSELWIKMQEKRAKRRKSPKEQLKSVTVSLVGRIRDTLQLLTETHRLAYTDDVSGLPNHRAARYVIERSIEQCKENRLPLSLLFIDGDNLRQYNDSVGYDSGNEMIRRLGAILSSATSPGDLVARWLSGDEFMIVLRNCPKAKAAKKATQLCEAVRTATLQWQFPITISVGVASYPDDALDPSNLIKKVEDANQIAKRSGKDRAYVYDGNLHTLST